MNPEIYTNKLSIIKKITNQWSATVVNILAEFLYRSFGLVEKIFFEIYHPLFFS